MVYSLGVDTPLGTSPHALYVTSLYGVLLDREPDASASGWVAQAASADRGSAPVRGMFFRETLGEKRRIAVVHADDAA
jgi:hypothetical protein